VQVSVVRLGQKIIWTLECIGQQYSKANPIANQVETRSDFWLTDSTLLQIESAGVAKVLQSEKYAMEILDTMDN